MHIVCITNNLVIKMPVYRIQFFVYISKFRKLYSSLILFYWPTIVHSYYHNQFHRIDWKSINFSSHFCATHRLDFIRYFNFSICIYVTQGTKITKKTFAVQISMNKYDDHFSKWKRCNVALGRQRQRWWWWWW